MRMAGRSWAVGALLAAGVAVAPVSAQEFSDEVVRKVMEYAWALTPQAFTTSSGETIQIDKKKKDEVLVPLEVAQIVIRAGRLSAHAQVCELPEEQKSNFDSLKRRLDQIKKWTPQQLVYLNQLHKTTLMLMTGRFKLVGKDGDKEVVIEEETRDAQTCSDEERQKVKEVIAAFVKTGPSLAANKGPAPAAAAAAGGAQPAAAPAKE